MAGLELPSRAIREQIVSALHFVVYVRRCDDGVRRLESIAEISGLESGTPLMQDLFRYQQTGRDGRKWIGSFQATGIVPRMVHDLRDRGIDIPLALFQKNGAVKDV